MFFVSFCRIAFNSMFCDQSQKARSTASPLYSSFVEVELVYFSILAEKQPGNILFFGLFQPFVKKFLCTKVNIVFVSEHVPRQF